MIKEDNVDFGGVFGRSWRRRETGRSEVDTVIVYEQVKMIELKKEKEKEQENTCNMRAEGRGLQAEAGVLREGPA